MPRIGTLVLPNPSKNNRLSLAITKSTLVSSQSPVFCQQHPDTHVITRALETISKPRLQRRLIEIDTSSNSNVRGQKQLRSIQALLPQTRHWTVHVRADDVEQKLNTIQANQSADTDIDVSWRAVISRRHDNIDFGSKKTTHKLLWLDETDKAHGHNVFCPVWVTRILRNKGPKMSVRGIYVTTFVCIAQDNKCFSCKNTNCDAYFECVLPSRFGEARLENHKSPHI